MTERAATLSPAVHLSFIQWVQVATNWINTLRFYVEQMALGDKGGKDHYAAVYGRRSRGFDPIMEMGDSTPGSEYEPFIAEVNFYCQLIDKMVKQSRTADATFVTAALETTVEPPEDRILYLQGGLAIIVSGEEDTYDESNPLGYLEWAKRFAQEVLDGEASV